MTPDLSVPAQLVESEALLYLRDGHGVREILLVGEDQEKSIAQLILIQLHTHTERERERERESG